MKLLLNGQGCWLASQKVKREVKPSVLCSGVSNAVFHIPTKNVGVAVI